MNIASGLAVDHGLFQIFERGSDKPCVETKTVRCCHCGGHFPFGPGKTKNRGFCTRCNGHLCGPRCAECRPMERMLEEMEGTKNPTAVSVGGSYVGSIWVP